MKKMKKLLSVILAVVLLLATFVPVSASAGATNSAVDVIMQGNLTVTYNGDVQIFCDANGKRVLPLNYQGTTYLPVRAVCALVGFGVDYDSKNYTVILSTKGSTVMPECKDTSSNANKTVSAVINRRLDVALDGQIQTFTDANGKVVYPLTYAGTTYVPVRAMANLAGIEIEYVSSSRTVVMTKDTSLESEDKDYLHSLALDAEFGKVAKMVWDGKIDGYVLGQTKFLAWKTVATGINSVGNTKYVILDHNGDFEGDFFPFDSLDAGYIQHYGSDVFANQYGTKKTFINLITRKSFNLGFESLYIIENFSDGFAIAASDDKGYWNYVRDYSSDREHEILLIGDNGKVITTGIIWGGLLRYLMGNGDGIARYGNGVFFLYEYPDKNGFYDKNGNCVLDLQDVVVENQPYFDGKYCWLEYFNNGYVWGAYMDINGNFAREAEKMYEK